MNKGRGIPFPIASVVSFGYHADVILFTGVTDVLEEGGSFDEPMAKLFTVLWWPSVGRGEVDPRWRRTA